MEPVEGWDGTSPPPIMDITRSLVYGVVRMSNTAIGEPSKRHAMLLEIANKHDGKRKKNKKSPINLVSP